MRPRAINIVLFAATLTVLLLGAESASRYRAYRYDRQLLDEWRAMYVAPGARVQLGPMISLSENERMIYELKPNLSVIYSDSAVHTNRAGFRGALYPEEKAPGHVRIVGLGDSVMFGQGVPDGSEYLTFLESALRAAHPERSWEAVNTAVPGYNTAMEFETLRDKGLRYGPDIVVVGFVDNDINLPNFIKTKEDYLSPRKLFFADYIRERLGRVQSKEFALWYADLNASNPDTVPPRYKGLVGWQAFDRAMEGLRAMGRERGFIVLVVLVTSAPSERDRIAMDKSRALGFHVIDVSPAVAAYMERNGIRQLAGSVLVASANDSHPSALFHRMVADEIYAYMDKAGIIRDVIAKSAGR